jgi:hypothetical protein
MQKKSPVTASEVDLETSKDTAWATRYLYVECSYCECPEDMMRMTLYAEGQDKKVVFEVVEFGLPLRWYVQQPWSSGRINFWERSFRSFIELWRRVKIVVAVLLGRPIYLSPGTTLNFETAKDFATKLATSIDEVKSAVEHGVEDAPKQE